MTKPTYIFLFCAFLFPAASYAGENVSGLYNGMPIAYDKTTNIISGYFHEETGDDGKFSCVFYFLGKLNGNEAKITSYYPDTPEEKIDGVLIISDNEIKIKLEEEHGGCWNVQHFADAEPASFTMDEAHETWRAVDIVKSKKAYFYSKPQKGGRLSSYLIQGDDVAITGEQGDWYLVEYQGEKIISGYIRKSDLYRLPLISNPDFAAR
jgi:hypothetical protein